MTANVQSTPVTVIGGFLGAGKTTLINRLLAAAEAPRCAILVNDFGEIAVDASLIKSRDGNTLSLKNGCVCCSMGNDLGAALTQALGLEPRPERIVIEASGVAHPGRIMDVARISKELSPGGIYVLVDAPAIRNQLTDRWIADTVLQQLVGADYLVPSKMQDMEPAIQVKVVDELYTQCPQRLVLNFEDLTWSGIENAVADQSQASDKSLHAHFVTRTLRSSKPLELSRLRNWIEATPGLYRMKGWFVDQADNVKLLQGVDQRLNIFDSDEMIEDKFLAIVIGNSQLPGSQAILDAVTSPQ